MRTLYVNARVYTMDAARPRAEAILVEDGEIASVGTDEDVRASAGPAADVVDLEGRMVMPGLHDGHLHLLFSGLKFRYEARLRPDSDAHRIIEDLAGCHHGPVDSEGNKWIIGGEYFPGAFGDSGPNKALLDEAFPDRPVFLYDYSIHHGLANTKALELAGISASTPAVEGGRIVCDPESGEPTGELVEQGRWPVMRSMPQHAEQTDVDAVLWAVSRCHEFGITSVQEASANPPTLRALRALDEEGSLNLHVAAHLVWREEGFGRASREELDQVIADRETWRTPHVTPDFIKIWLDGAPLPPHLTQADLSEDGAVDESKILVPPAELVEALCEFDAQGLTVKMHCAGDGAARTAVEAVDEVRRRNGPDGPAHEIAHAGFVSDQDLERLAGLCMTAEMSPALWHVPEYGLQDGFRFRSVLDHRAPMTVGSDWIITESPNLFPGLQGMLEHGPESITLDEALHAVTLEGARAIGRDDRIGTLSPGKSADFIVLDRDLYQIPVSDIGSTRVLRTIFEGRTIHATA
ncbi:amidohydrolase [Nesterenkonia suensis]